MSESTMPELGTFIKVTGCNQWPEGRVGRSGMVAPEQGDLGDGKKRFQIVDANLEWVTTCQVGCCTWDVIAVGSDFDG